MSKKEQKDYSIALLAGWEQYKADGVECTIEEYVDEVLFNTLPHKKQPPRVRIEKCLKCSHAVGVDETITPAPEIIICTECANELLKTVRK